MSDTFDIQGCSGTATITLAAATSALFERITAVASQQTTIVIGCPILSVPGTTYYDAQYANLGFAVSGGEYSSFQAAPTPLPSTVQINNSGSIVTLNTYSSSAKTLPLTGTRVLRWQIEADGTSTTTAIFNLITENYNASNLLLSLQQSRYRMALNGALTYNTIDVQFFDGTRVLYTKR